LYQLSNYLIFHENGMFSFKGPSGQYIRFECSSEALHRDHIPSEDTTLLETSYGKMLRGIPS
jgi:hypothetical protein